MQKTKPSTASLVYAAVISNPGITARELKKLLTNESAAAINSACFQLTKRGALAVDFSKGERSGQYSKGKAPVVLRNAVSNSSTAADLMTQELKAELIQGLQVLQQLMVKLEKI